MEKTCRDKQISQKETGRDGTGEKETGDRRQTETESERDGRKQR